MGIVLFRLFHELEIKMPVRLPRHPNLTVDGRVIPAWTIKGVLVKTPTLLLTFGRESSDSSLHSLLYETASASQPLHPGVAAYF